MITTNVSIIFRSSLLAFILIFPLWAASQEIHSFRKGLSVNAGARYGREALYTDNLAYKLYSGTLSKPVEGAVFGKNDQGQEVKWTPVSADTSGRFSGRGSNSYVYLTYSSSKAQPAILNIRGNSAVYVNGELHAGDPYASGWMNVPVRLVKGENEFYVRGAGITATLNFPAKPVFLDTADPTLPFIVPGQPASDLKAGIVVINTSAKELRGLQIKSKIGGKESVSSIAPVPGFATRKVIFSLNGDGAASKGMHDCEVSLIQNGRVLDTKTLRIQSVDSKDKYSTTFISGIDGSLQYYAVAPKSGEASPGSALFLSVHGAGVEAIGQARAYESKDWGNLVAATNRRPRGFNWEDWGRIDALEVLALAKARFAPDPQHIYLTGHSMGGHGTWFLGATYPDKWAAIAPAAGYPTLKGYGSADGLIPDSSATPMGRVLLRASNQSDVPKLAVNYKPMGVYIMHGDADRTVSVNYARQMRQQLAAFHPDFSYYEHPGGSHWYGSESVDWKPMFEFLKWHKIAADTAVNTIEFMTASPGISPGYRWASIHQQTKPLEYSKVKLSRDLKKGSISGTTENVRLLRLNLADFSANSTVDISLDNGPGIKYTTRNAADSVFLLKDQSNWKLVSAPGNQSKGPHRYGTFKDGFNKNMVYVYGTSGNREENEWSRSKAMFDAETWYYRGNGAIDIITDKEYSRAKYAGRNVVLIGNASTNSAWNTLLDNCPVKVSRGNIRVGEKILQGDDLAAYFVWPIAGTDDNSVSVISGSGLPGMKAANGNQYFAGASGFPDLMVFRLGMLNSGIDGVEIAGFFNNEWKLDAGNIVVSEDSAK